MEAISIAEAWGMKSGQRTDCNLSGHYTHYAPIDSRPQHPTQTPRKGNTYNTFVPWVWFCLGNYFAGGSLSVCKHLMLPSTRDREIASFSRAGPWARGQASSSCPTEVKAGWQATRGPWEHSHMLFLKCNGATHAPPMLRVP